MSFRQASRNDTAGMEFIVIYNITTQVINNLRSSTGRAIKAKLDHPQHGFLGYHTLAKTELTQDDMLLKKVVYHTAQDEML